MRTTEEKRAADARRKALLRKSGLCRDGCGRKASHDSSRCHVCREKAHRTQGRTGDGPMTDSFTGFKPASFWIDD